MKHKIVTVGSSHEDHKYSEHKITGLVNIKRLANPFGNITDSRKAYRELKLMRKIKHENIIEFLDVYSPETSLYSFEDVYIMTKLMVGKTDQLIRTESLNQEQISYIIYQILCGLKEIHSAGIIHGDLKLSDIGYGDMKPGISYHIGNLGKTCPKLNVRILNFGLAISIKDNFDMVPYGIQHYCTPEELSVEGFHGFNVDIWSVGCIFAELLIGRNRSHEWSEIIKYLGHPVGTFADLLPAVVRNILESLPNPEVHKVDAIFRYEYFPTTYSCALTPYHDVISAKDLLKKMLTIDPENRISLDQALDHPYVNMWRQPPGWFDKWFNWWSSSAPLPELYDDSEELANLDTQQLKELYFEELCDSP